VTKAAAGQRLRVLIVEDHFAVADSLRLFLENSGFEVTGMAGTVAAATALVERGGFDVAVLDIRLGSASIAPVADRVAADGLPIVFISGYSEADILPEPLRSYPRLSKPCDPAVLAATLRRLTDPALVGS
jgi:DNA-binding response OmpR family regulator